MASAIRVLFLSVIGYCTILLATAPLATAFVSSSSSLTELQSHQHRRYFVRPRNAKGDHDDDSTEKEACIPQLPAVGASAYSASAQVNTDTNNDDERPGTPVAFVGSSHFQLQYTCKVCDTRNCNRVSRLAYQKGMVVAVCKGCKSKHLIADNLGSGFPQQQESDVSGSSTIEEYFESQGLDDEVSRVSPEVFELEKILQFDTKGGSLPGEDGDSMLE